MRNRIALAAMGAAMLLVASAAGVASAQTPVDGSTDVPAVVEPISVSVSPGASVWDNCLHGQACVFQSANGTGLLWVVPSTGYFKLADYSMDNRISSAWNRSGFTMRLYDTSTSGWFYAAGPYTGTWNVDLAHNDKASYLRLS